VQGTDLAVRTLGDAPGSEGVDQMLDTRPKALQGPARRTVGADSGLLGPQIQSLYGVPDRGRAVGKFFARRFRVGPTDGASGGLGIVSEFTTSTPVGRTSVIPTQVAVAARADIPISILGGKLASGWIDFARITRANR
jgi:hypothetical protein